MIHMVYGCLWMNFALSEVIEFRFMFCLFHWLSSQASNEDSGQVRGSLLNV